MGNGMTRISAAMFIVLGLAGVASAITFAQSGSTANVEVRVWQRVSDAQALYISARPEGGSWRTLGTIPLGRGEASAYARSASGSYRYSDITLAEVRVDVRVWQRLSDARRLYISARPVSGSWRTLGTIPLDMSGRSSTGTYRYGDIIVRVPLSASTRSTPTPTPVPTASPTPSPTPTPETRACRWDETAARVVASTVKVTTPSGIAGTAFYVGDGQWITAGHVVDDRPRSITLSNARIRVSARVVGFHPFTSGDVALLAAPASGAQPLGWAGRLPLATQVAVVAIPKRWARAHPSRAATSRGTRRGTASPSFRPTRQRVRATAAGRWWTHAGAWRA